MTPKSFSDVEVQDILNKTSEDWELERNDSVDNFKTKERREIRIRNKKENGIVYVGIVEIIKEDNKVIKTSSFELI